MRIGIKFSRLKKMPDELSEKARLPLHLFQNNAKYALKTAIKNLSITPTDAKQRHETPKMKWRLDYVFICRKKEKQNDFHHKAIKIILNIKVD